MKNTLEAARYFSVPTTVLQGTADAPIDYIYQRKDNLLTVRTAEIKALRSGRVLDICVAADLHFNYLDAEDFAANDPCLMSTYENRIWLRGGSSMQNAIHAVEYGLHCDQLIVAGDILDFYSHGALAYTKKYLWDACPDAIACLGGHDVTCKMQGLLPDTVPIEEKYKGLQEIWGHDIQYYSRLLDERVLIIQMNNDMGCYTPEQYAKLSCDLAEARKQSYTVLLLQHEPFSTGNPNDTAVERIRADGGNGPVDMYHNGVGRPDDKPAAVQLRELVTSYSDVVRAVLCGHYHSDLYTELVTPSGDVIPQYILTANAYRSGNVLHIKIV